MLLFKDCVNISFARELHRRFYTFFMDLCGVFSGLAMENLVVFFWVWMENFGGMENFVVFFFGGMENFVVFFWRDGKL